MPDFLTSPFFIGGAYIVLMLLVCLFFAGAKQVRLEEDKARLRAMRERDEDSWEDAA